MRRIAGITALLAALALSGCATTGFLGFLVTTRGMQNALAERDQEIAALQAELQSYRTLKADTEQAIAKMTETFETVEELEGVAQQAEARIAAIPNETIRRIIELLQAALK
jgi:predicted  nucleic acid-binding Zn-ribbon protein